MTVKITIEVTSSLTEEDKILLTSATIALMSITNSVLDSPDEEDAPTLDPPTDPAPTQRKRREKEIN